MSIASNDVARQNAPTNPTQRRDEAHLAILENLSMIEHTTRAHFDEADPARSGVARLIGEVIEDLQVLGAFGKDALDDAAPKSGPVAKTDDGAPNTDKVVRKLGMIQAELAEVVEEIRETTRKELDEVVYAVNEALGFEGHKVPATHEQRCNIRDVLYRHVMRTLQSLHHVEMLVESVSTTAGDAKLLA